MAGCIFLLGLAAAVGHAAELTVAAAADLSALEPRLVSAFEEQTGIHVTVTLGASGILRQQIENGAPYDVFLSANEQYVRDLAAAGVVDPASVRIYALGRLGLWGVRDMRDLLRPEVKHLAMANPAHAPYGAAAEDFLRRRGIWDAIRSKVVFGENVRQALQYAETGNAEAVITAWSLVLDKKDAVLLPADHAPIRQAVGIVKGSKEPDAARRFEEFLFSEAGRKLLSEHGLMPAAGVH